MIYQLDGIEAGFVETASGAYLYNGNPLTGYITSQNSYDLTDIDFLNLSIGGINTASVYIGVTVSLECIIPTTGEVTCSGTSTMGDYVSGKITQPMENVQIDVSNLKGNYQLRIKMFCWNKRDIYYVSGYLTTPIKIWGTMK